MLHLFDRIQNAGPVLCLIGPALSSAQWASVWWPGVASVVPGLL